MNFELDYEQATIQRTVEDLLYARLPDDRIHELLEARAYDDALWRELCQLGFAGLAIPEEYGGQGLSLLELGLVIETLGRWLAPVPLLANAAAGLVIAACGNAEQRAYHLPGIAAGDVPAAIAVLRDGRDPLAIDTAAAAPLIILDEDRALIADESAVIEDAPTIDLMRRYAAVSGHSGELLSGDAAPAVDAMEVLLAAELTGVAQRALDLAVSHALQREQFGRPIGSFQGVSHRCSIMLADIEAARSTWRYAACIATHLPEELPLAASTAKVAGVNAAKRATASSLQVHGGIGFTWEHPIHLLLRRARVGEHVLAPTGLHLRRIARIRRAALMETVPASDEAPSTPVDASPW